MPATGGVSGSPEVIQIGPSGPPPTRWLRVFVAGAVLIGSGVVWLLVRDGPSDSDATAGETYRVSVSIPAGPHLLGVTAEWELFARGRDKLVRVELATGRVTRTSVPELSASGVHRAAAFIVGPDRVVVRPYGSSGSEVFDGDLARFGYQVVDGELPHWLPPVLGDGTRGFILPGPKPGTVWVPNPHGTVLRLVRLNGDTTDISIRLPRRLYRVLPQSDGSGYVLDGPPGVWRDRPGGRTRISSGILLATGPTGWLVRECRQGRPICGRGRSVNVVVDRRRGTRRVLPGPAAPFVFSGVTGVVAPDGTVAAMFDLRRVLDDSPSELPKPTITLLDLHTGKRRSVPVTVRIAPGGDTIAWSPNSRWLFVPRLRGGLAVVDAATGDVHDFDVPLPRIEQLAVRTH